MNVYVCSTLCTVHTHTHTHSIHAHCISDDWHVLQRSRHRRSSKQEMNRISVTKHQQWLNFIATTENRFKKKESWAKFVFDSLKKMSCSFHLIQQAIEKWRKKAMCLFLFILLLCFTKSSNIIFENRVKLN